MAARIFVVEMIIFFLFGIKQPQDVLLGYLIKSDLPNG
jgi:hypothetical protein